MSGIENCALNIHACGEGRCSQEAIQHCPHCQRNFCMDCKTSHYQTVKSICDDNINKAILKKQFLTSQITRMQGIVKNNRETLEEAEQRVNEFCKQLHDVLEDAKKNAEAVNINATEKQISATESAIESLFDVTSLLKNSMDLNEDLELLWEQRMELNKRINSIETQPLCVIPMQCNFDLLSKDFAKLKTNLQESLRQDCSDLSPILYKDKTLQIKPTSLSLSEYPHKEVNIQGIDSGIDAIVVANKTQGFKIQKGVVVRDDSNGNNIESLPSPAIIISPGRSSGNLLVLDEHGDLKGNMLIEIGNCSCMKMAVRELETESHLLVADDNNECIRIVDLSGKIINTSDDEEFTECMGDICWLARKDYVAVCELEKKVVKVLSLPDLCEQTYIAMDGLEMPSCIAATQQFLYVIQDTDYDREVVPIQMHDVKSDALFLIKMTQLKLKSPWKIVSYKGSLFVADRLHGILQLNEAGALIAAVDTVNDKKICPSSLNCFTSTDGRDILLADHGDSQLCFFAI